MIGNDMEILQHWIENWQKQLPDYIQKLEDKIVSRVVLPVRRVGDDVAIDVVERFDRTGTGAKIAAKGAIPQGSGFSVNTDKHEIYQILDGFRVNEKDLKYDAKIKSRAIEIILANIQRTENRLAVLGDVDHSILGMKGAAEGNPAGVYEFADIVGPWDGSGTAPDIYRDVLGALNLMDPDFTPKYMIGNRKDLNYMMTMDAMRGRFVDDIAMLFGQNPTSDWRKWAIAVGDSVLPEGAVYIATYDPMAAEFIVSENVRIRAIPMQEGGNYPIEILEWVTAEFHDKGGFVKIETKSP